MPYKNKEDILVYRRLWMRRWRAKNRAGCPDGRKKNGKNQLRHVDGKFSISKDDAMMLIGVCNECKYENSSETAICSKPGCPLMIEESPFTFPFSNGSRPQHQIQSKENSKCLNVQNVAKNLSENKMY